MFCVTAVAIKHHGSMAYQGGATLGPRQAIRQRPWHGWLISASRRRALGFEEGDAVVAQAQPGPGSGKVPDELRPCRPRIYVHDQVAEVINRALQSKPTDGSSNWNARSLAAATEISKTTVHRWLQTFSVQPDWQKHYRSAEA